MLRLRRIPRLAHWQRTPDMCTFSWFRLPRQRSASRFPSWIPIRNASMATASRCEYSHREAAATRTRKEALLAANSRRERSLREFAAMGHPGRRIAGNNSLARAPSSGARSHDSGLDALPAMTGLLARERCDTVSEGITLPPPHWDPANTHLRGFPLALL
jgi:hypothetical protein